MIRMKIGGMILTGFAAYLVAGKAVHAVDRAVSNVCEASKWKSYYKCWSRGKTQGEPVAPGYSRTTRPDNADYEIVDDPKGNPASDIQYGQAGNANPEAAVNAVCEAVKTAADKAIDTLFKGSKAAEGAKEGQTEASVDVDDEDLKPWHIDIRVNDEGEGEIHECDEKEDDAEEENDETVD